MQGSHQKEKEALIAREGMEESRRSHPNMMSHPVMLRSHFRSLSLTSCFLFSYSLVNLPMFSILDMERKTFCLGPVAIWCNPSFSTLWTLWFNSSFRLDKCVVSFVCLIIGASCECLLWFDTCFPGCMCSCLNVFLWLICTCISHNKHAQHQCLWVQKRSIVSWIELCSLALMPGKAK